MNIRYDPTMGENGAFLLRCDDCANAGQSGAYWELTTEFWSPTQGLQRCLACHRGRKRSRDKQTPEQARAQARAWYKRDREKRLAYARDYLEKNREHINAERRRRNALRRDVTNAHRRELAAERRGDRAA